MIPILYEDQHIIVVNKPIKMPVQKDRSCDEDVTTTVTNYLSANQVPYVGLVNRLDRPVGGVVIFAKSKKAHNSLNQQIQDRMVKKEYIAIVNGTASKDIVTLTHYMSKNSQGVAQITDSKSGKKAVLNYQGLHHFSWEEEALSLVLVQLETGRFHQIRLQMATSQLPIYGDTKYNPYFQNREGWHELQLFAYRYQCMHPITNKSMVFTAQPEHFLIDVGQYLKD